MLSYYYLLNLYVNQLTVKQLWCYNWYWAEFGYFSKMGVSKFDRFKTFGLHLPKFPSQPCWVMHLKSTSLKLAKFGDPCCKKSVDFNYLAEHMMYF